MYLSRLKINEGRIAQGWLSNPYRIHQRLKIACSGDPRMLFRLEEGGASGCILVQTHNLPDWAAAFNEFPVLAGLPEVKEFHPLPGVGQRYAFRLAANPTVKRDGRRVGLLRQDEQQAWLERHLADAGAELLRLQIQPYRVQRSGKGEEKGQAGQVHLVVTFEGLLLCRDAPRLGAALAAGVGPAKGYGCGLLSLARTG